MNFQKAKIYKIWNNTNDKLYIGSSCSTLGNRMAKHRYNARNSTENSLMYDEMRRLGIANFFIELMEETPCQNIEQLRAIEGKYIRKFGTLNKVIAGRTHEEWCDENREYKNKMDRIYHQNHKEQNRENNKKWRENNKEYKKQKAEEYEQKNKEIIKEKKARYYLKVREKLSEEVVCEICGTTGQKRTIKQHERSKQHQQALENLNDINNVLLQTGN